MLPVIDSSLDPSSHGSRPDVALFVCLTVIIAGACQALYLFCPRLITMSNLKPNIGVYTDPQHNLWIDKADPPVADIESGAAPGEGEVVVEIRSTGICGYGCIFASRNGA